MEMYKGFAIVTVFNNPDMAMVCIEGNGPEGDKGFAEGSVFLDAKTLDKAIEAAKETIDIQLESKEEKAFRVLGKIEYSSDGFLKRFPSEDEFFEAMSILKELIGE